MVINIGIIGLGQRGFGLLKACILNMEDINVVAVSDLYIDRMDDAAKIIKEKLGQEPRCYEDYKELLDAGGLDAVLVCTPWESHIYITIQAMRMGIMVGCEVGGANSIDECWELVRTYEETKTPLMFLENCCFCRNELMILRMVQEGVFGEIVHCEGGYRHDLRQEITNGREIRHYRLNHYLNRNCHNYPTHDLGPISKILNINNGNRLLSLSSISSKSIGLNAYARENKGIDSDLAYADFAQGDVITTIIRCAGGQTITLTLDTSLPRYYSRNLQVHGTKGMFSEDNRSFFIDGIHKETEDWSPEWNNIEKFRKQYEHPLWVDNYVDPESGHGGIDWITLSVFFDCVRTKKAPPIDVYDMVTWACVTTLSEQSIARNGEPVAIPDFTNGRWINPVTVEYDGVFNLKPSIQCNNDL